MTLFNGKPAAPLFRGQRPLFGGEQPERYAGFITVGGHAEGDEKHVGGQAIPLDKLKDTGSGSKQEPAEDHAGDYARNGVKSKAFKKWFGDWENDPQNASAVVNEDGEPQETLGTARKVFHGTTKDFSAFSKDKASGTAAAGAGFYFAEDKRIADNFGEMDSKLESRRGKIIEAYLNIRNPFAFDSIVSPTTMLEKFLPLAKEVSPSSFDPSNSFGKFADEDFRRRVKEETTNGYLSGYAVWEILRQAVDSENVNAVIAKAGHDGLMHDAKDQAGSPAKPGEVGKYGRVWVAFEPVQIKAVDNVGSFNPESADFRNLFHGEQPERYSPDDTIREMQSWSDSKLRAELREAGFVRLESLSRKELLAMLAGVRAAKVKRNAADEARVKESPPEPALTILDVKKAIAEEIKAQPERVMVTEILRDECGRPRKTIHRPAKDGEF